MAAAIILASSSVYRRALLNQLGLDVHCEAAAVDERRYAHEPAAALALRLAIKKATHVASSYQHGLIIGADQTAAIGSQHLGKPGNYDTAKQQLQLISGQCVNFYTGLCVNNAATGDSDTALVNYQVTFRTLTAAEIERYLNKEAAFDCTAGFKSEGLGISLVAQLKGDDQSALVGLPLLELLRLLRKHGVTIP